MSVFVRASEVLYLNYTWEKSSQKHDSVIISLKRSFLGDNLTIFDLFKKRLSLSFFWKHLFQVSFKHRNCNSTEEASNIKLIFWGSNKNRHSTKCLKLMKIKWKIISDQVFAKKRYGTYFFWHAKIPNFSLKTCWFLRILGSYEHKVTRRPILHPQAPTWPTGT